MKICSFSWRSIFAVDFRHKFLLELLVKVETAKGSTDCCLRCCPSGGAHLVGLLVLGEWHLLAFRRKIQYIFAVQD